MKIFLVVCLAVAALADSDPQLLLNSPFYSGLAYPQQVAYPQQMVYLKPELKVEPKPELKEAKEEKKEVKVEIPQIYAAPAIQSIYPYAAYPYTNQIVPKYVAKNGAVEHIVAKREAEADPQMFYGLNPMYYNTQPMAYTQQMVYNTLPMAKTYANDFNPYTQNYAAKGQYVADSVGARHVAKREAEAEADPQMFYGLNPMYYNTKPMVYNAQPMIYNTQPIVYNTQPMIYNLPTAKTYANDYSPFTQNYAAKGQYVADSVGARHVAKREAEAEPQYLAYNGLYNGAYAPYRTAYNYGYTAYNPIYSGLNYPVYG